MVFDYRGAVHIHSKYSFDGRIGMEEIINAAAKRGLDYIIVTDHFNQDAKEDGWEGWHNGVLVIVGQEISPRYNHYLAVGTKGPVIVSGDCDTPQLYIDKVKKENAVGMIAHPDHTGAPGFGIRDYKWDDWKVQGYDGMSVWDLMTDWQESLTSPFAALKNYWFPSLALTGPKPVTLKRWDDINKTHKVFGFGEIDNHDSLKKFYGLNFRIFPFKYAFDTIRTHLLLENELSKEAEIAKIQIMLALRGSNAYISFDRWNDPEGFVFRIHGDEGAADIGKEIKYKGNPLVGEVLVPKAADISFFWNGIMIKQEFAKRALVTIDQPGVYRVEVKQKVYGRLRPWIYSNHIFVY